jgi:curved DNA-binding protein CbpA
VRRRPIASVQETDARSDRRDFLPWRIRRMTRFSSPDMEGGVTTVYGVLGVDPEADTATIRHAYRALARRHHPDFGGDTRYMARINDAWHVISHPERRADYDRQLRRPLARPVSRVGHTVMRFGQYEGWSLADIAEVDENYLLWLSRMTVGRPLRREITAVLAERSAALEARRPRPNVRKRRWGVLSR